MNQKAEHTAIKKLFNTNFKKAVLHEESSSSSSASSSGEAAKGKKPEEEKKPERRRMTSFEAQKTLNELVSQIP